MIHRIVDHGAGDFEVVGDEEFADPKDVRAFIEARASDNFEIETWAGRLVYVGDADGALTEIERRS